MPQLSASSNWHTHTKKEHIRDGLLFISRSCRYKSSIYFY
uniref:Uncharacterized protein n=1 Tax=Anguilla anguilla TaxID=7936 RepID=A0A0E9RAC1_ANGAN